MLDTYSRRMHGFSQKLPTPSVPSLFVSDRLNVKDIRVRAGTVLIANSQTDVIPPQDFGVDDPRVNSNELKVEICEVQGRLFASGSVVSTASWIKEVTLATDHHCCNVELEAEKDGLVLRVNRTIARGEPLLMWFGERFRSMFDIPFLTGCFVDENLTYKCHLCSRTFEGPNPLKLHIALNCDRLNISFVWQGLATKYSKPSFQINDILTGPTNLISAFPPQNYPQMAHFSYSHLVATTINPLLSPSGLESPFHIRGPTPEMVLPDFADPFRRHITSRKDCYPNVAAIQEKFGKQLKLNLDLLRKRSDQFSAFQMGSELSVGSINDYQTEAFEMGYTSEEGRVDASNPLMLENVASSNGKTNDGNFQCVICRKKYSRKYGLKIHFRTHTGYKPLTCKYCGRAFGDPSNLNKHVRLHLNAENARYKCKHCGKGLVRRRDLERHIQKKHQAN